MVMQVRTTDTGNGKNVAYIRKEWFISSILIFDHVKTIPVIKEIYILIESCVVHFLRRSNYM